MGPHFHLKMYSVGICQARRRCGTTHTDDALHVPLSFVSVNQDFFYCWTEEWGKRCCAYQNLQVPTGIQLVPDPSERVSHVTYGWLSLLVTPPLDISSD